MYKVTVTHRQGGSRVAEWATINIPIVRLDQVVLVTKDRSLVVTIYDPNGQTMAVCCGPEVQVRILRDDLE